MEFDRANARAPPPPLHLGGWWIGAGFPETSGAPFCGKPMFYLAFCLARRKMTLPIYMLILRI